MKSTVAFAVAALTTLGLAASAGAATAGLYSGHFPLAVTQSQRFNGQHCLILTDDGGDGFPHSGPAAMAGAEFGTFQIIGHTLVVTFEIQGGSGQNAGDVFSAPASSGILSDGVFDEVYGGESVDSGKVVFGKKGGC